MYRFAALVCASLVAALVTGCAPSKSDIEKSIREEMKSGLGVEISKVDLEKQADGSYSGTAIAVNGDTYEVTTTTPKAGKSEWKAIPGQVLVERTVRQTMDAQLPSKVRTLNLKRQSPGVYSGTADLENGLKMSVSTSMDGKTLNMNWKPADGQ